MNDADSQSSSSRQNAAHAILALPDEVGGTAWDYMQDEPLPHDCFLWVDMNEDTETIVERWNTLVADGDTLTFLRTNAGNMDEMSETFAYGGKELDIPFAYERSDAMIAVVTLNQLVKNDAELRLCSASSGSSELAFLALSPAAWKQLESEFGCDAVTKRFRVLTANAYESGLL